MKKVDLRTDDQKEEFFSESNFVVAEELSKAIVINEKGIEVALRCEAGQAFVLSNNVVSISEAKNESDVSEDVLKKVKKKR